MRRMSEAGSRNGERCRNVERPAWMQDVGSFQFSAGEHYEFVSSASPDLMPLTWLPDPTAQKQSPLIAFKYWWLFGPWGVLGYDMWYARKQSGILVWDTFWGIGQQV